MDEHSRLFAIFASDETGVFVPDKPSLPNLLKLVSKDNFKMFTISANVSL
jgi:hypothetical protein